MFIRRCLFLMMTLAIFMTGLAPVSMAAASVVDKAPAKTVLSMSTDCHEQKANMDDEPANTCATDAACTAMCIMHAFQPVSFAYAVPFFNGSVPLPVLLESLTSKAHEPSFRPPIA